MLDQILIDGPSGKIESLYCKENDSDILGVICYPHPLYQGTMHNKVVTTLNKAFLNCGADTVRFNFRGVGLSEGGYSHGIGELEDLKSVLNYFNNDKYKQIWLSGFSFGSYIAAQYASKESDKLKQLILVAPPVNKFDFVDSNSITCNGLIITAGLDDIVSPIDVKIWHQALINGKLDIININNATHFFHGCLPALRLVIEQYLK